VGYELIEAGLKAVELTVCVSCEECEGRTEGAISCEGHVLRSRAHRRHAAPELLPQSLPRTRIGLKGAIASSEKRGGTPIEAR